MILQGRTAANAKGIFEPRHEHKYFISQADYVLLRSLLSSVLKLDSHSDRNGEYFIRSLYFDDMYNTAYYTKMEGVEKRDKYRIRIYNCSDGAIFLERKHKEGEYIMKQSARITRRLCDQLIQGRCDNLEKSSNPLLQEMYREMRVNGLKPVVIVDYSREAYMHPIENVRITFDKRLHTGMYSKDLFNPQLNGISPIDPGLVILEVKYDRYLPEFIRKLLSVVSADHCAISKYTLCRRFEPLGE